MSQEVFCPYCNWKGQVGAEKLGTSAQCPNCKRVFILTSITPTSSKSGFVSNYNPQVRIDQIPQRIKDVLWEGETVLYASRPAHSALVLSMIVAGIVGAIVGLGLAFVGIFVTLPLALIITYYSWKNRYYIITKERSIASQGIFNVGITIIFNRHIQLIAINTGIIDRWIGLNTVEVSTAAQGGAGGIMSQFPGLNKGACQFKSVNVKDVIGCYDYLRQQ